MNGWQERIAKLEHELAAITRRYQGLEAEVALVTAHQIRLPLRSGGLMTIGQLRPLAEGGMVYERAGQANQNEDAFFLWEPIDETYLNAAAATEITLFSADSKSPIHAMCFLSCHRIDDNNDYGHIIGNMARGGRLYASTTTTDAASSGTTNPSAEFTSSGTRKLYPADDGVNKYTRFVGFWITAYEPA